MSQDALYLASKSNYQHILDGTLPSGVSYPEALAENLSSKRTNHKLAEQGRRNRINNALKEIELLSAGVMMPATPRKLQNPVARPTRRKKRKKRPTRPSARPPPSRWPLITSKL
jgi:Helix-loop-helix DNA-binding domain.